MDVTVSSGSLSHDSMLAQVGIALFLLTWLLFFICLTAGIISLIKGKNTSSAGVRSMLKLSIIVNSLLLALVIGIHVYGFIARDRYFMTNRGDLPWVATALFPSVATIAVSVLLLWKAAQKKEEEHILPSQKDNGA